MYKDKEGKVILLHDINFMWHFDVEQSFLWHQWHELIIYTASPKTEDLHGLTDRLNLFRCSVICIRSRKGRQLWFGWEGWQIQTLETKNWTVIILTEWLMPMRLKWEHDGLDSERPLCAWEWLYIKPVSVLLNETLLSNWLKILLEYCWKFQDSAAIKTRKNRYLVPYWVSGIFLKNRKPWSLIKN